MSGSDHDNPAGGVVISTSCPQSADETARLAKAIARQPPIRAETAPPWCDRTLFRRADRMSGWAPRNARSSEVTGSAPVAPVMIAVPSVRLPILDQNFSSVDVMSPDVCAAHDPQRRQSGAQWLGAAGLRVGARFNHQKGAGRSECEAAVCVRAPRPARTSLSG